MTRLYTALADYADNQVAFRAGMQIKLDDAAAERIQLEQPNCIRVVDERPVHAVGDTAGRATGPYRPQASLADDSTMHSGNMPISTGWQG